MHPAVLSMEVDDEDSIENVLAWGSDPRVIFAYLIGPKFSQIP